MVPRRPDDPGEARNEDVEGGHEVFGLLADVTGHDQPVVRVRADRRQRLTVDAMTDVEVADRQQAPLERSRHQNAVTVNAGATPSFVPAATAAR